MAVPDNVVNKKLYASIKKSIDKDLKKKGQRWSAYASGRLVSTYKKRGGSYKGKKNKTSGLSRWFDEKWIDVCQLPKRKSCGRKSAGKTYTQMKKDFPYCRPSKRVNKNTPKTVSELSKKQLQMRCKKKRSKVRSRKK